MPRTIILTQMKEIVAVIRQRDTISASSFDIDNLNLNLSFNKGGF